MYKSQLDSILSIRLALLWRISVCNCFANKYVVENTTYWCTYLTQKQKT